MPRTARRRRAAPATTPSTAAIANDCVLVPTFNGSDDRRALGLLTDLFPGRTVVGIHTVDLVWCLGALHCLAQQQPDGEIGRLGEVG
jgi:agmatine/peptidylarginine deiminase